MNTEYNPYAPPNARLGDEYRLPRVKPRTVALAVTALWVAYGITLTHAVIIIGDRWLSWPPEFVALNQIVFEVVFATGRSWFARSRDAG